MAQVEIRINHNVVYVFTIANFVASSRFVMRMAETENLGIAEIFAFAFFATLLGLLLRLLLRCQVLSIDGYVVFFNHESVESGIYLQAIMFFLGTVALYDFGLSPFLANFICWFMYIGGYSAYLVISRRGRLAIPSGAVREFWTVLDGPPCPSPKPDHGWNRNIFFPADLVWVHMLYDGQSMLHENMILMRLEDFRGKLASKFSCVIRSPADLDSS